MATATRRRKADSAGRRGEPDVAVQVSTGGLKSRQHRGGLIALLAALVVVFALAGAWLYSSAGSKTTVVVAASDIDAGQVISRSDLTTTDIAGDVSAVAADDISSVVGKRARVALVAGTLLQRSMTGVGADIPDGHVLAGVLLPPGAAPASGVVVGDRVDVYRLPQASASGGEGEASLIASDVAVHQVTERASAGSSGLLVTLVLPQDAAAETVAAAGVSAVSVTVVGP